MFDPPLDSSIIDNTWLNLEKQFDMLFTSFEAKTKMYNVFFKQFKCLYDKNSNVGEISKHDHK
jgi:hypothetical protein